MDFGISLDPSCVPQRHCLEDSDEDEEAPETADNVSEVFKLSEQSEQVSSGSNLILAIGQPAAVFSKSYLNLEPLPSCTISTETETVFKDKHFPGGGQPVKLASDRVSDGFNVTSSNSERFVVCTLEQPLKSQYCSLWCAKIFELFQPKQVVILTSQKSYEFLTSETLGLTNDSTHSVLRTLQSSSWKLEPLGAFLEPPNTVIGEAAAGLTHCHLHGVPAALVVCYSTSTQSIAESAQAFQPILKHPFFSDNLVVKSDEEAAKISKKLVPRPREDLSSLYT